MAIEYLGLSSVNGPLVVLEGLQDAFYDEIVEFTVEGNIRKMGRIIELNEDKAVIQVFEGTQDMSLQNTHTRLTGRPMEVEVSPDMLGRTFNGIGIPVDGLGPIGSGDRRDVNGLPFMDKIDVLVDGKFIEERKNLKLHWRGSDNQSVIDVKKSLASGKKVLHCD